MNRPRISLFSPLALLLAVSLSVLVGAGLMVYDPTPHPLVREALKFLLPIEGTLLVFFALQESRTVSRERQLLAELRASEIRFRKVVDDNPSGLFFWNARGLITDANDAFLAMVGYTREELAKAPLVWRDIVPQEYQEIDQRAFQEEILVKGKCSPFRKEFQHRDGSRIAVLTGAGLLGDSKDQGVGFAVDISAQVAAEQAKLDAEARYKALADHSPAGIWQLDSNGCTVYANPRMLELLQLAEFDEIAGQFAAAFFTEQSWAKVLEEREKRVMGIASSYEAEIVGKNGRLLPVLVSGGPLLDPNGQFQGVIATFTDLTELKQAQNALQQSEKRFRALVENANEAISIWDGQGRVILTTRASERISGYSFTELEGRNATEVVHEEDRPKIRAVLDSVMQEAGKKETTRARVLHRDGRWRLLEGVFTNLVHEPAVGGVVVNYRDITNREAAEAALRESEARLQAFLENSPSIMFLKDTSGRYLKVNPSFERAFGVSEKEAVGKTDIEVMVGSSREACQSSDAVTMEAGKPMEFEELTEQVDGPHTSIVQKFPIRDAKGRICAIAGIITDITERERVQEALRRSEERYRNLFENARDAIFTVSPDGLITSRNSAAAMLSGRPDDEVLNCSFAPFIAPEDLPLANEMFARAARGERSESFEIGVLCPDGVINVEFSLTPQLENGAVVGILGIGRDVSQRRKLEAQLRQAQKMECVGQLAGGIAHDFNNLLTIVSGNASLITLEEFVTPAITRMAREICDATNRATRLTRQLLAFSRGQPVQATNIALEVVTSELINLLQRLIGADIALRFTADRNLPNIHADTGMMEQVLVNLSVNARDAMPKGGRLTIHIDQCTIDSAGARCTPDARPGHFVRLSVADTGSGIAPEHLSRIFEPFFTTKDVGKGTGLGLATVYGIVKQHQGWIEVHSVLGSGTKFDIYFPPSATMPEIPPKVTDGNGQMDRGKETILLVEDEAGLRGVVRSMLCRLGYEVLEACSGVEALKVWEEHRNKIDLVFTDIVMPDGLSGPQLAAELRKQCPGLKVLFTSGYSAKALTADVRLEPGANYLQKPYPPERLATAIRNALQDSTKA